MGKTKVLQFNPGDIVESIKYDRRTMLIVDKLEKQNRAYDDPHIYYYTALDLLDGQYYGIYTSINNKHYKIVGYNVQRKLFSSLK